MVSSMGYEPGSTTWGAAGAARVFHRSDRCPMAGPPGPAAPGAGAARPRPTPGGRPAPDPQRALLYEPHRLPMALAAPRLSGLVDRALLLRQVAAGRHLGAAQRPPARS